jgi:hypothetical protein
MVRVVFDMKGNKMCKVFWASRHMPTTEQAAELESLGYTIAAHCDIDAWADACRIADTIMYSGATIVFCVHPRIALCAHLNGKIVLLARNTNRAPEGSPPVFEFGGFEEWPGCERPTGIEGI